MAAGPRLIFVRFATRDSPKLKPWMAHTRRVIAGAEDDGSGSTTEGFVVWQLVSANHRELARGTDVHETFEEARATAAAIAAASDSLSVENASEAGHGMYGWYLTLDGRPVATCARWYLTERDRRNSMTLAVHSLGVATINAGTRLSEFGRERASFA